LRLFFSNAEIKMKKMEEEKGAKEKKTKTGTRKIPQEPTVLDKNPLSFSATSQEISSVFCSTVQNW